MPTSSALPRLPHARAGNMLVAVAPHLRVDALGRAAQRELAQREEVALAEEVLHGALGLLGQVDLALAQPLQQVVRRKVDQHDFVGLVEHRSGTVSRTSTPVMPPTMSFRLSRCWTLTVV